MSRPITTLDLGHPHPVDPQQDKSRYLVPLGRLFFVLIFLTTFSHFQAQTIAYAAQSGVPLASVVVPLSGVIALAGLWVINNLNLSSLPTFTEVQRSITGSSNDSTNRQSRQTTGQGETTGSSE